MRALELGCNVGQLLTPLHRYHLRDPSKPRAIDNGAFSNFSKASFLEPAGAARSTTARNARSSRRRMSSDSARRTLEVLERWAPQLDGWRLAIVCQDGRGASADTVGRGRRRSLSAARPTGSARLRRVQIIQAAQLLGKHVHVGRVIGTRALGAFRQARRRQSADGTGNARYSHARGDRQPAQAREHVRMKCTYEIEVRAQCPVEPDDHRYLSSSTIESETPDRGREDHRVFRSQMPARRRLFQEALTRQCAVTLGAAAVSVGWHSGVKVTCLAP